jgi:hypothetical protein
MSEDLVIRRSAPVPFDPRSTRFGGESDAML